jgi:DNA recombination protein RmuC
MAETLWVFVGVVTGAAVMWVVARGHFRSAGLADREVLSARVAAAEALAEEIRKQLVHRDLEVVEARGILDRERAARVQAEARGEATRQNLEEQRLLLEQMQARLGETFKALSSDALRDNGTSFLTLAGERLAAELGQHVRPLHEALGRYETQLRELEASRQQAYGGLEQQVRALALSSAELQREAGNLVTALRTPHVRGRWGEITLHRVVELAGMTPHCDYVEQVTVERDGARLRPDMVVHLPVGRQIVVDAKVPLTAYLDAVNARTPEDRAAALGRHAHQVRQHLTALAGKAYWEEFGGAAELVVMFIPGEAFVAAAVEMDPALLEDGMAKKVVIATPTTLIALLRAIAFGWRQEQIADNAERICELGRQLYDRLRTLSEHFDDVGRSLARATAAFNKTVGSMESRVLPAARRFRDLGAATGAEIPPLEVIDQQPRELTAPEYSRQFEAPGLTE